MTAGRIAVIGGGPAGLAAADVVSASGIPVDLYETMPSVGRKLLMAGKGGLNLSHSEPADVFLTRYGEATGRLAPFLADFGANAIRAWCEGLGISTFIGTSGRIFPKDMKAAPLLRAWLKRLRGQGVVLHVRHRWRGWDAAGAHLFATPQGPRTTTPVATVLALGGGSWPQLGSDGGWTDILARRGVPVRPLIPANCGFDVPWSEHFSARYQGQPVKPIVAIFRDQTRTLRRQGECIITTTGIEGGVIYALAARARDAISASGAAVIHLDLRPDRSEEELASALGKARGKNSFATYLRKSAGLYGVKAGLIRELLPAEIRDNPRCLAQAIKSLPITLARPRPLKEAISSAGGVAFDALTADLMVRDVPGLFCAGEMLDWEAPTGGYLLTACLATGRAAGAGAAKWVQGRSRDI